MATVAVAGVLLATHCKAELAVPALAFAAGTELEDVIFATGASEDRSRPPSPLPGKGARDVLPLPEALPKP